MILLQELRHALRRIRRSPGFTTASVVTLGMGIGATTAVFSVVHSTVIRALPYPESDRLVWLDHAAPGIGSDGGLGMTDGLYVHYRESVATLGDLAIWTHFDLTLEGDEPERLRAVATTASLFSALRVRPQMGTAFNDEPASAEDVGAAVISHGLWLRRFGGRGDIVGHVIRLDGGPVPIVGVLPADFAFPAAGIDVWVPLPIDAASTRFGGFSREGIARLAPGATLEMARAELAVLIPGLRERFGVGRMLDDTGLAPLLRTLKDRVVRDSERTLWILFGSVGFVLLLACANVANLFLVRAEGRQREIAVRRALGAGRRDIVRHFLSEGLILSLAGGAAGLALAALATRLVIGFGPEELPRLAEIRISGAVLLFTAALTLVTSLAFGLLPALRREPALAATIKSGRRRPEPGTSGARGRTALVATQIALSLVLIVATGLMSRSFIYLMSIDPGFRAADTLTFEVGLTSAAYPDRPRAVAFHREALDRLSALPGVESVGATTCLPLCGSWAGTQLTVDGRPDDPDDVPRVVAIRRVHEGYFATMGVRLVSGRLPGRIDQESQNGSAAISRELAEAYWPGEDPLGGRFQPGAPDADWYTVVGIVEDTPIVRLADSPPPMAYLPLLHGADRDASPYELAYVLRTSVRPQSLLTAAREVIRSLDEGVPLADVASMEERVAEANVQTAFTTVALGISSVIALLLGVVGIHGVISYTVGRRAREIGIRMALGARVEQVCGRLVLDGARVAAIGLAAGLLTALALTRLMRSMLVAVSPTDPLTFVAATVVMLGVALLATWIPARRAARIDPAETLRAD